MKNTSQYLELLEEIKSTIVSVRIEAARSVNKDLIRLYWQVGELILKRQQQYGWGKNIVEALSKDLRLAYPDNTSFSARNLWSMRQLYLEYVEVSLSPAKITQGKELIHATILDLLLLVPWGHNILIMQKAKSLEEREYYLHASIQYGWSRSVLLNQIKADAYRYRQIESSQHNFEKSLEPYWAEQAEESIKSNYNLEFLGIAQPVKEREMENQLIERLEQFLLELGYGFAFIGRQYKLLLGENEYFTDLLFYHRKLRCLVAFELKTTPFKPEHAGKMGFYLEVLDEKVKEEHENPSIGIILCAEKDKLEVEYSLRVQAKPMGVVKYRLTRELPRELMGQLPTLEDLKKRLPRK